MSVVITPERPDAPDAVSLILVLDTISSRCIQPRAVHLSVDREKRPDGAAR